MRQLRNRKSNRRQGYDYSQPGWYFVTICAKNREHHFGFIQNDIMCVNRFGSIVHHQWRWMASQYPYIRLDAFIVMPNHVHGIFIIHGNAPPVGTGRDLSLQESNTKIKSLSELIGAFKTTSSKLIRRNGLPEFAWQRSFHDHSIRTTESYFKIRSYITQNPRLWDRDRNNTK